ncbi:MAG TPA: phosphonopyruvate decarboxylase [Chroococcales cyanobacterium]
MPSRKIEPQALLNALADEGLCRCLGVPDSTLEAFIRALEGDARFENLRATNECEAIAVAMGQYLATRQPSLVYLQNSGFGKTIHPITSLLSSEIFVIPALLLIGWRGDPDGKPDEPQHKTMGRVMPALLDAIGVPFAVLEPSSVVSAVRRACAHLREKSSPYALIVRPGSFAKEKKSEISLHSFTRKRALQAIVEALPSDTLFVSTTGKASRELFFLREEAGIGHASDLYVVGGMGCASAIGLGLALKITRTVCVVDGDGAALMQLGTLATIGHQKPDNLIHLLIDNECYESTGGQPSISPTVDFPGVARACGYPWTRRADSLSSLQEALKEASRVRGLRFLAVKVEPGSDPELGRPGEKPRENAENFMGKL